MRPGSDVFVPHPHPHIAPPPHPTSYFLLPPSSSHLPLECTLALTLILPPSPCRRAFEKHFKEWRHQNGMRSLGIPNNKNFYEVTKIADAESLWANIQVGVGLGVRV